MKGFPILVLLAMLASALSGHALPPEGIWTNVEDAYFAEEEGRIKSADMFLQFRDDGFWRPLDAYGGIEGEWRSDPPADLKLLDKSGWAIGATKLRRARPFACWVSVRKFTDKADGNPDWSFTGNLPVFDQGGRIAFPGSGLAPDVTLRMRNVTWSKGSRNKPSLVIYMHKDDPERAEAYSWASPDATLIGINLRWVQASCSPVEEQT
ncbi:hypothetical protein A9995_14475 [Erythrobacter sp. QSSC1-22B]|nr:hypothetical protein A9995_14475 [Erythrobacter sp. QSSC1-22B]